MVTDDRRLKSQQSIGGNTPPKCDAVHTRQSRALVLRDQEFLLVK
jgi:hypothetical protein